MYISVIAVYLFCSTVTVSSVFCVSFCHIGAFYHMQYTCTYVVGSSQNAEFILTGLSPFFLCSIRVTMSRFELKVPGCDDSDTKASCT
jgi:hypothetical protein